jgi:DNA-binding response OmpR family regulator
MSFGWDIDATGDPSMAVRLATFRKYDAVVADLQFAHWQCRAGSSIIEAVKRRDRRSIAILLGTSLDHAESADCLLLKPVALGEIAHSIRARLAQSDPHAAVQQ